jgi:hypothetical protein
LCCKHDGQEAKHSSNIFWHHVVHACCEELAWPCLNADTVASSVCPFSCSQATPFVAAVALLIRNAFPSATAAQVIQCIKSTSLLQPVKPAVGDSAGVKKIAGGILNAAAAFECVKAAVQPTPSPSPSPALSQQSAQSSPSPAATAKP